MRKRKVEPLPGWLSASMEPGAPIAARGGSVGLGKALEQAGQFLGIHANAGIADLNEETRARLRNGLGASPEDDVAMVCELDGVAEQVEHNLTDTAGVAGDVARAPRVKPQRGFQTLLGGLRSDEIKSVFQCRAQIEGDAFQFHLTRLNLRKVQNPVDQFE